MPHGVDEALPAPYVARTSVIDSVFQSERNMQAKHSTFSDRQAASAAAKKALLEKFKPKPMIVSDTVIDHEAERRERIEAIRKQREEERQARQRAREEAEAAAEAQRIAEAEAAEQAKLDAQTLTDQQKREDRKARKKAVKEAARIKKETRQVARPASSRGHDDAPVDPYKEHERYIRSLERARA